MSAAKPSIRDFLANAEQAERAGDLARAAAIYENILAHVPKHSKARKALLKLRKSAASGGGKITQADADSLIAALNSRAFEQVVDRCGALLVHNRKEPFLYNIQGLALGQLGRSKAAISSYKQAVKLNPAFAESLNNLGMLLVSLDRPEEAVVQLNKAIKVRPSYLEAHQNLGVALTTLGRLAEALKAYDKAIELNPKYANALNSRAALYNQMMQPDKAIQDYESALRITPDDSEIHANLSYALVSAGHSEAGLARIEKAVQLNSKNTAALLRYAIQLNEHGRNDEAKDQLRSLLALEPKHAEALRILSGLQKVTADAAFVPVMKDLMSDPETDADSKVHLGFGLGKALEDMGDHETGFSYLKTANDLNFARLSYSQADENVRFAQLKNTFSAVAVKDFGPARNTATQPILIVGMMRSGTSLVEQILASHSQVWGAGELMAATQNAAKTNISEGSIDPDEVSQFAVGYLAELSRNADNSPRITDKMPGNFAHIGLMKLAFSNVKIVNMVRDPRDNCYSIYKNFFDTAAHQYAYDLEHLANFANQYKSLMRHWHNVFPGQIYDCNYEALTENQEEESRKLLAYCELDWEPQILDFHKTKRSVRTASVNQVRQKIYKSSVRSWERVADGLKPLIDGLDRDLWSEYLG